MDQQLQRLMGQLGGGGGAQQGPASDMPTNDNSETIYISSLALLKVCLTLSRFPVALLAQTEALFG
jgi:hypothetical protein